jgi:hypothetical protein
MRRKKTTAEQYKPYLRKFMSWKDGTEYPENTVFTEAQLLGIRPRDLVRWMNKHAYKTEDPGPEDKPIKCQVYWVGSD